MHTALFTANWITEKWGAGCRRTSQSQSSLYGTSITNWTHNATQGLQFLQSTLEGAKHGSITLYLKPKLHPYSGDTHFPLSKKFKVIPSVKKIIARVFCGNKGPFRVDFFNHGKQCMHLALWWYTRNAICRNRKGWCTRWWTSCTITGKPLNMTSAFSLSILQLRNTVEGVQLFYGRGPHPLLQADWHLAICCICNCLNYCVTFTVYIYNSLIIKSGGPHASRGFAHSE
jgi:hypothetical protein